MKSGAFGATGQCVQIVLQIGFVHACFNTYSETTGTYRSESSYSAETKL